MRQKTCISGQHDIGEYINTNKLFVKSKSGNKKRARTGRPCALQKRKDIACGGKKIDDNGKRAHLFKKRAVIVSLKNNRKAVKKRDKEREEIKQPALFGDAVQ